MLLRFQYAESWDLEPVFVVEKPRALVADFLYLPRRLDDFAAAGQAGNRLLQWIELRPSARTESTLQLRPGRAQRPSRCGDIRPRPIASEIRRPTCAGSP